MEVDEPRCDDAAGGVEDRRHRRRRQAPDGGDATVGDQHVGAPLPLLVDDRAAADHHGHDDHLHVPARAEELEQHGHPHGDAVGDLLGDHGPGQLGGIDEDLDAPVHRTGVHHQRVVGQPAGPLGRQPEARAVLPQARHEGLLHALSLHPQQVQHVDLLDHRVEVVGGGRRGHRRQQRGRGHERDVGSEQGEDLDVAAGHPAVADVADDGDAHAVEPARAAERGAHGVGVEQRLGRVGVPAVAAVDDAGRRPPADLPGHAAGAVADDEGVDAHRRHRLDGVAEALALVDAGRPDAERHHVGRQALGRRLERQAGPRRVLEEQVADRLAAQRRHLRVGPPVDLGHRVGEVEQAQHAVGADLADRAQVLHDAPSRFAGAASRSADDLHAVGTHPHVLGATGREVLADEVGADRQLPVAAVDEHGELHGARPAVLGDGVEGGAHGAAGVQHVVDEHHGGVVEITGISLRPAGTTGRIPMSSRYSEASIVPTGTARSMRAISAPRRWASHTPPVCRPSSTRPSRPPLRSRISCAMRVVARRTSSGPSTRLALVVVSFTWCPPSGPHGTRFTVVGEGSSRMRTVARSVDTADQ